MKYTELKDKSVAELNALLKREKGAFIYIETKAKNYAVKQP